MKKILLIDDQDWEFEILESAVTLSGQIENMQCRYASNPDEALALLEEIKENLPDYIFLDVNLGGIYSGTDLLTKLKNTNPYSDIPVIMYTTEDFSMRPEFWQKSGANYFLTKPTLTELKLVLKFLSAPEEVETEKEAMQKLLIQLV
ncbi:MAG: hypothetical protein JWO06_2458 [Bacteroidota bacterium]|nr:hypothetical protein [Bacteroidota bacterium]